MNDKPTPLEPPVWRVGRKVGRTLYRHGNLVGLLDTPELARLVVAALNESTAYCEACGKRVCLDCDALHSCAPKPTPAEPMERFTMADIQAMKMAVEACWYQQGLQPVPNPPGPGMKWREAAEIIRAIVNRAMLTPEPGEETP